ncbi:MAG TPA: hypothetical protein VMX17_09755 [Candidatus Glassbacteria bacterium]|nr:hypothetical protein [Candidatus Glassbacteria bacterium]
MIEIIQINDDIEEKGYSNIMPEFKDMRILSSNMKDLPAMLLTRPTYMTII